MPFVSSCRSRHVVIQDSMSELSLACLHEDRGLGRRHAATDSGSGRRTMKAKRMQALLQVVTVLRLEDVIGECIS